MKLRYVATSFNGRLCVFYLIFTSAKNLHIENLVYNQNRVNAKCCGMP